MTLAEIPISAVLLAPFVAAIFGVTGALLGLPRGFVITVVAIVYAAAGPMLAMGVRASCAIDESECLGATATAYVFGALWLVAGVAFLVTCWRRNPRQLRSGLR